MRLDICKSGSRSSRSPRRYLVSHKRMDDGRHLLSRHSPSPGTVEPWSLVKHDESCPDKFIIWSTVAKSLRYPEHRMMRPLRLIVALGRLP
jgi:hypothetical protein